MSSVYLVLMLLIWSASSVDANEQIEARFSKKLNKPDYYLITTIPEGATRINVTESLDTQNYLAVRKQNGKYLFNGPNNRVKPSGNFYYAGTTFVYTRRQAYRPENFYASGPLNESLDVMLLYSKGMPDVFYQYELPTTFDIPTTQSYRAKGTTKSMTLPRPRTTQAMSIFLDNAMLRDQTRSSTRGPLRKKRRYDWKSYGYSNCSKPCGGGVLNKVVFCVKLRGLLRRGQPTQHVPNSKCDPATKPLVKTLKCNSVPCPPRWELGPWSECSVSCGNGTRSRQPICRQVISEKFSIQLDDSHCSAVAKADLDATTEVCLMTDCSKYSTTTTSSTITTTSTTSVEPSALQSSNIVTTRRFVATELPRWKVGDWSQCSKSCGSGSVRTRPVTCIMTTSGAGPDCDSATRPPSEESCLVKSCELETPSDNELPMANNNAVSASWLYSHWPEQCSAECGTGIVHRRLYCESESKDLCDESKMPEFNKTCYSGHECGAQWFVGPWTKCSSSCDTGVQTRDVICVSRTLDKSTIFQKENCPPDTKPDTIQTCQGPPCNATWYMSDWSECTKSCGGGIQRREVKCIGADGAPTSEAKRECDENKRPISQRGCNAIACSSNPIVSIVDEPKNATDSAVNEKQPIAAEETCRDVLPGCAKIMESKAPMKNPCRRPSFRKGCCLTCQKRRRAHQIVLASRKNSDGPAAKNSL